MKAAQPPARRRIRVTGLVQGVGFRPFVWRLAHELDLAGWVCNDGEGVSIEVQGDPAALDALVNLLRTDAPPAARVEDVDAWPCALDPATADFSILPSPLDVHVITTVVSHDRATCPACLTELFDPDNRRWRHPFITCTQCGPRYTISRALPYDRARTSMAVFPLCTACAHEYADPGTRRFHSETNACPGCGPRLALIDNRGNPIASDPIAAALSRLAAGQILAVKGLGGFHLMADARQPAVIARLRWWKHRGRKPFALMLANLASARQWVQLTDDEATLLASPERPITVCAINSDNPVVVTVSHGLAPGFDRLGLMLPYTPIQYLLFHEAAGRPVGTDWLREPQALALVCTSANPGGETLITDNATAQRHLNSIADAFLDHDRDILNPCDDSVVQVRPALSLQGPQFIRRARGYTPHPIQLGRDGPPVLAFGASLKNTVCLTRGAEAFFSPHIGNLDSAANCHALDAAVDHLQALLGVRPLAVAHDLHPDFPSTHAAQVLAARLGIPAIAVQHHHAHLAAIAAEHAHRGPFLGLALDGFGLGSDGSAWGGELLRVEGASFSRLGHLALLAQPGGDLAAREPWRMAAAMLHRLGRSHEISERFGMEAAAPLAQLLRLDPKLTPSIPLTSSLGRQFDAAAGLLGVCLKMSHDSEAALRLETLASRIPPPPPLDPGWILSDSGILDLLPLFERLADENNAVYGAALFHSTLAAALAAWVQTLSPEHGDLRTVALGGGCCLNRLLTDTLRQHLLGAGFTVLEACAAPPNDGGLALGQAHVARLLLTGET
ncbi:carbamoyltransferase HypF [Betaproteobacteria bacterium]|nr:carbamoyltransferase HypF [Betaproteobacteria bacterium]